MVDNKLLEIHGSFANVLAHGQKTVAFLSHAQMLWLLDFKAFPPCAPPSASQVKFRCPLDGVKTPTAIVSLIHSYTLSHLHILIKRDNIRINIKVNLAPTIAMQLWKLSACFFFTAFV